MMYRKTMILSLCLLLVGLPLLAQSDFVCEGAPAPRLVVGEQAQVVPGAANNMRHMASLNGMMVGQVPGGALFDVTAGPVCADGYVWWEVDFNGATGWTVEGNTDEYWLEPLAPAPAEPALDFHFQYEVVNQLAVGVEARVIDDNGDGSDLLMRATPSQNADVVTRLPIGTVVSIVGEAQEAEGLRWWQISVDGQTGWAVEGIRSTDPQRWNLDRTLVAACPAMGERIGFRLGDYIYSADNNGENWCIHERTELPEMYTFYPYSVRLPNTFLWSPDYAQVAYLDSNSNLLWMSADGLQQANYGDGVIWADWSPDGERFLMNRITGGDDIAQVWTMRSDGTLLAQLSDGEYTQSWAAWLGDSETVLFVEEVSESATLAQVYIPRTYVFYTINVNTGGLQEIYRTGENADLRDFSLAPDGTRLALYGFDWSTGEPSSSELVVLDTATGEVVYRNSEFRGTYWVGQQLMDVEYDTISLLDPVDGASPQTMTLSGAMPDMYTSRQLSPDGQALFITTFTALYRLDLQTGNLTQVQSIRPLG